MVYIGEKSLLHELEIVVGPLRFLVVAFQLFQQPYLLLLISIYNIHQNLDLLLAVLVSLCFRLQSIGLHSSVANNLVHLVCEILVLFRQHCVLVT